MSGLEIQRSSFGTGTVLCCLVLCIGWLVSSGSTSDLVKHRIKRKVVFTKSSKFFFRINLKENVFNYTDIFVHGLALRVNYDLPSDIPKRHKFFKREANFDVETIQDDSSTQMYSCVFQHFCDILERSKDSCGIFCEIGKIIMRSQGLEADFFKGFLENCHQYRKTCPYETGDLSVFNFG